MSQGNAELVSVFYPGDDFDVVPRWCDPEVWLGWESVLAPRLHPDFKHVVHGDGVDAGRYLGLEGLRAALVEWYQPWAEYRIEVEEAIDLGDRVLVLSNSYGRMKGSEAEVRSTGAAVFTIREGKIAAYEDYVDRADALNAVGLTE
jgi:ketosteroid isomerase-like protein